MTQIISFNNSTINDSTINDNHNLTINSMVVGQENASADPRVSNYDRHYDPIIELKELLDSLEQHHRFKSPNENEKRMIVSDAFQQKARKDPAFKDRLLSALQSGGIEAGKVFLNHPFINITSELIRGWFNCK